MNSENNEIGAMLPPPLPRPKTPAPTIASSSRTYPDVNTSTPSALPFTQSFPPPKRWEELRCPPQKSHDVKKEYNAILNERFKSMTREQIRALEREDELERRMYEAREKSLRLKTAAKTRERNLMNKARNSKLSEGQTTLNFTPLPRLNKKQKLSEGQTTLNFASLPRPNDGGKKVQLARQTFDNTVGDDRVEEATASEEMPMGEIFRGYRY